MTTSQSTTEQTYIAATNALPPELGSRAPAWLFPLVFWVYTALSILWLAIGLLPGLLPMASLPYRQVLDAAPDVRWLRNLWFGLYIASLRAEPLAAEGTTQEVLFSETFQTVERASRSL